LQVVRAFQKASRIVEVSCWGFLLEQHWTLPRYMRLFKWKRFT